MHAPAWRVVPRDLLPMPPVAVKHRRPTVSGQKSSRAVARRTIRRQAEAEDLANCLEAFGELATGSAMVDDAREVMRMSLGQSLVSDRVRAAVEQLGPRLS